jgi:hypothetical protein
MLYWRKTSSGAGECGEGRELIKRNLNKERTSAKKKQWHWLICRKKLFNDSGSALIVPAGSKKMAPGYTLQLWK